MSILTRDEILKEIRNGKIEIEPFTEDMVGPGSVDLSLGNRFRTFRKLHEIYDVTDDANFHEITNVVEISNGERFVLMPQETILGITRERVKLPPYICGWLEGRSRFARLGLMVHITAGFMQPGINNHQVLEIANVSSVPLALHPGTRICQFIFQKTLGEATYSGKFAGQEKP
ncbi:MAG: dCTP deaminase [Candidatus Eremiobacteraeota bacterium]|nr:dCTP deaminase [Candidatus Eremiobacteraeota bacterium]